MSATSKAWDGELVRKFLESRFKAARLEQADAYKRGYEAQDDYDKAAAEEWVCRTVKTAGCTDDQAAFAAQLAKLLAQDEYRTGLQLREADRRYSFSSRRRPKAPDRWFSAARPITGPGRPKRTFRCRDRRPEHLSTVERSWRQS